MLYSGVFEERVSGVFDADAKLEAGDSSPRWGIQDVDDSKGMNDRLTSTNDWSVLRNPVLPGDKDSLFKTDYQIRYTEDGAKLRSALGKVKGLINEDGNIKCK